jgi:hypothetical protein
MVGIQKNIPPMNPGGRTLFGFVRYVTIYLNETKKETAVTV